MNEIDVINNFDLPMRNSYSVIVGEKLVEDLIHDGVVFFAHDVDYPPSIRDLEDLIDYFADRDEFEKCIKLKNKKNERESN